VRLPCPECQKTLVLPARLIQDRERLEGKRLTCPSCQARLGVSEDGQRLVTGVTGAIGKDAAAAPPSPARGSTIPGKSPSRRVAATQVHPAAAARTLVTPSGAATPQRNDFLAASPSAPTIPSWVWAIVGSAVIFTIATTVAAAVFLPSLLVPKQGEVQIDARSVPKDAIIVIDTRQFTPSELEKPVVLPVGEHVLAVNSARHEPFRTSFSIVGKTNNEIKVTLLPLPTPEVVQKEPAKEPEKAEPKDVETAPPPSIVRNPPPDRPPVPPVPRPVIAHYEPVPKGAHVDVELTKLLDAPEKFANKIVVATGLFVVGNTASRQPDGSVTMSVHRASLHCNTFDQPAAIKREESGHIVQVDPVLARQLVDLNVFLLLGRATPVPANGWGDSVSVLTFHVEKRVDDEGSTWVPRLKEVEFVIGVHFGAIGNKRPKDAIKSVTVTGEGPTQGISQRSEWTKRMGRPYVQKLEKVISEAKIAGVIPPFRPMDNSIGRVMRNRH
jgi:hypothetical protein